MAATPLLFPRDIRKFKQSVLTPKFVHHIAKPAMARSRLDAAALKLGLKPDDRFGTVRSLALQMVMLTIMRRL